MSNAPKTAGHTKPQNVKQPPTQGRQQQAEKDDEEEYEEEGRKNQLLAMAPSWLFSFVSHLVLILFLAFWVLPFVAEPEIAFTSGTESGEMEDSLEVDLSDLNDEAFEVLQSSAIETDFLNEVTEVSSLVELPATEISDIGSQFASEELAAPAAVEISSSNGNELSGRTPDSRKQLARENGASAESEESVDLALEWIVKHQLPNGSWSFDHTEGDGAFRKTTGRGVKAEAKIGATAIALLPLLGAGHTHITGKHKEAVEKGFEFLKQAGARRSSHMISYAEHGGDLYSHGLATIALCECYAMTYDKELEPYAQGAINFTIYAQNPTGGGWQYHPRQGGDTSAVGWQLMALKSAKISGLKTEKRTFRLANQFLDSVSNSRGTDYGYMTKPISRSRPTLASIGLLCRMYLGWKQDRSELVEGMARIAEVGPDTEYGINMYYNYYATQAIKHMYSGKPQWKKWNLEMREFLVSTQEREGNTRGSWYFAGRGKPDRWGTAGGRLYDTAMSCMTLEVYYRFLPIYDKKATDDSFELLE